MIKGKTGTSDYVKVRISSHWKGGKRQTTACEVLPFLLLTNETRLGYLQNSYKLRRKRQASPQKHSQKMRQTSHRVINIHEHRKRCWTSLKNSEMKIISTRRYYFTATELAKIGKSFNTKLMARLESHRTHGPPLRWHGHFANSDVPQGKQFPSHGSGPCALGCVIHIAAWGSGRSARKVKT